MLCDSHSALGAVGRNVGIPLASPSSSEGVGSIPGGRTDDACLATLGLPDRQHTPNGPHRSDWPVRELKDLTDLLGLKDLT